MKIYVAVLFSLVLCAFTGVAAFGKIRIQSRVGCTYTLMRGDTPSADIPVSSQAGTGEILEVSFSAPSPVPEKHFFRVKEEPE